MSTLDMHPAGAVLTHILTRGSVDESRSSKIYVSTCQYDTYSTWMFVFCSDASFERAKLSKLDFGAPGFSRIRIRIRLRLGGASGVLLH